MDLGERSWIYDLRELPRQVDYIRHFASLSSQMYEEICSNWFVLSGIFPCCWGFPVLTEDFPCTEGFSCHCCFPCHRGLSVILSYSSLTEVFPWLQRFFHTLRFFRSIDVFRTTEGFPCYWGFPRLVRFSRAYCCFSVPVRFFRALMFFRAIDVFRATEVFPCHWGFSVLLRLFPLTEVFLYQYGCSVHWCFYVLLGFSVLLRFFCAIEIVTCFSLSCKANARVSLAKTGHGPHIPNFCIVIYFPFSAFCVLFVCHRVSTQLQVKK
jgi:hypothetical protein